MMKKKARTEKEKGDGMSPETTLLLGLDLLVLREVVSGEGLDYLLANLETSMVKEEQTKFKRYASDLLAGGNVRVVTYAKSTSSNGRGRVYADGALSMQGFSKGIRAKLAGTMYHDIDMENCHPVLLLQVCALHGWQAPLLSNYVNHREEVLAATGVSRDKAKVAMLTIMYGGSPKHAVKGGAAFKQEMSAVADRVFKTYPDIPVSNQSNPKFSRMSLLLQDIEHTLLMEVARFFRHNGYEIGVYVYDGLMLYRKTLPDDVLDTRLLRECEKRLTWKMTLVEKM